MMDSNKEGDEPAWVDEEWLKYWKHKNAQDARLLNAHYIHKRRERMGEEAKSYELPYTEKELYTDFD